MPVYGGTTVTLLSMWGTRVYVVCGRLKEAGVVTRETGVKEEWMLSVEGRPGHEAPGTRPGNLGGGSL